MTEALWYLARGTGVVSLTMLTVVVVLGIGSRAGVPAFGLPRFAVNLLHRNAALMVTVLLAIHVVTLLFDPYAQLKVVDLLLPFDAPYRPLWTGLGTLGADLLVALMVTSLLRHRIGPRTWRAVHWLAYAMWPVAWLHGIGTGTDRATGWYLAVAFAAAATVAGALIWRCSTGFGRVAGRRTPTRRPARSLEVSR